MNDTTTSRQARQSPFATQLSQAAQALRHGRFDEAVALLEPWTSGPAERPEALQLMGVALMRLGQLQRALECLQRSLRIVPRDVVAWVNLASVQTGLGRTADALQSFAQALEIDPMQPAVHFNRGNLLLQLGDAEAACESFRRAAELAPDRPDPACNLAVALAALSRHAEALQVLQDVVARHPGSAAAWNLLAAQWQQQGHYQNALDSYQQAVQCEPPLVDAFVNGARLLAQLQRFGDARKVALRAVQLDARHEAAVQLLKAVMVDGPDGEGTAWLENAPSPDPADQGALGMLFELDAKSCDWAAAERGLAALRHLGSRGHWEGMDAWRLLSHPLGGEELRNITEAVSAHQHGAVQDQAPAPGWRAHVGAPRPARLRIGYFSSDFHQHPTAVLLAGMLEQHDRSRFETVGFCFGAYPQGDDPMRRRVRSAFDRFEQVEPLDDADTVRLARDLDIHIAIDLKGHTTASRMGLFARRVAPLQMHYLGYPGTLGMPQAIDYLLADRVVVPPQLRGHYSEKIIELPDSYQVNDRQRPIDARTPTREELGLPAGAFVFCCFNDTAKITRDVFAVWMDLLEQRPGSVLWLLASRTEAMRNLRAAAVARGIAPERLLFAQRVPLPQHLARHVHADLFLDTWPCNAHTTASDALWAGLPVLTCAGETFAARVGASLLHACGLPELVTDDPRAYRDKALALSAAPHTLQALRRRLADTRLQVPLFDTERFTRHIESAYDLAWERLRQGMAPEHFPVPASS